MTQWKALPDMFNVLRSFIQDAASEKEHRAEKGGVGVYVCNQTEKCGYVLKNKT